MGHSHRFHVFTLVKFTGAEFFGVACFAIRDDDGGRD
jgi:hypothetical protein